MTRVNSCQFLVDFTAQKSFGFLNRETGDIPYCRVVGYIKSVTGSRMAEGLRFLCYGPRSELVYAAIQKGARALVICHVQTRTQLREEKEDLFFTEFVIEEIQYVRGINEVELEKKMKEMLRLGSLPPDVDSMDFMMDPEEL